MDAELHFLVFLVLHFSICKIKLQLMGHLNLLSHDKLRVVRNLTQNIIREANKVEKKKRWIQKEFYHIPELMVHLENDLYFQATHSLLLLRNKSIRKNILPYHK